MNVLQAVEKYLPSDVIAKLTSEKSNEIYALVKPYKNTIGNIINDYAPAKALENKLENGLIANKIASGTVLLTQGGNRVIFVSAYRESFEFMTPVNDNAVSEISLNKRGRLPYGWVVAGDQVLTERETIAFDDLF